jgi:hypothetical protein
MPKSVYSWPVCWLWITELAGLTIRSIYFECSTEPPNFLYASRQVSGYDQVNLHSHFIQFPHEAHHQSLSHMREGVLNNSFYNRVC